MWTKFKNWLRASGIKYQLPIFNPLSYSSYKRNIVDVLNPFDLLIEDSSYPLARIYRKGFWQGIADTYNILIGKHYDVNLSGHGRKGLLDVLIFPVIARRLSYMSYAYDDSRPFNKGSLLWRIPLGVVGGILEIARGALAVGLTLACSPLVAIVQGVAYFKAKKLRENIANIRPVSPNDNIIELFRSSHRQLFNYSCKLKATCIKNFDRSTALKLTSATYTNTTIGVTQENYAGIKALREMNIVRSAESRAAIDEVITYLNEKKRIRNTLFKETNHYLAHIGGDTKENVRSLFLSYADGDDDKTLSPSTVVVSSRKSTL
jgi:hypothetical protein